MKRTRLGHSELLVSEICLGSMTWGEQNSATDAFAQIDYALDQGINFIDTAELYAVPPRPETYGATEAIIGQWLKQSGRRHEIILASKVCGPTDWCPHIRDGRAKLDRSNILKACDASLNRLGCDHIDLYQVHWPERSTNYFGKLNYVHSEAAFTPIIETLEALSELVAAGKVRHIGISNETAWGAMHYLQCAERLGLERIVSIQNPYNLLNRSFEIGLAEVACREQTGLLAYSPLAFGMLSGKYLQGARPEAGRLTLFADRYRRYSGDIAELATEAYVALAERFELNPVQMALAFIRQQPFVTSTIIGATTMAQLQENIASIDLTLSSEVIEAIEGVFRRYPNPCP